jgi:hypothetical protein
MSQKLVSAVNYLILIMIDGCKAARSTRFRAGIVRVLRDRTRQALCVGLVLALAGVTLLPRPSAAIVGGEVERGPLVRQIVRVSICTGILIARDVVLTAAHCATGHVQWRDGDGALQARVTRESVVSPAFRAGIADARVPVIDLALLRLEEPVPPSLRPVRLSQRGASPGESLIMSGFGEAVQGEQETAGTLRSAIATAVDAYGGSDLVAWLYRDGTVGACKGDSGGALTRDGLLVGVVTSIVGRCGHLTRAVLVGPQRAWIDDVMAGWGRSAAWSSPRDP